MDLIKKYNEYKLNEDGEGGAVSSGGGSGTAFATLNGNGMGNIVTPQVGSLPGSVWQNGSGTIGSGDRAAYDKKTKFDFIKKGKKGKKGKKDKLNVFMKYSEFLSGPNESKSETKSLGTYRYNKSPVDIPKSLAKYFTKKGDLKVTKKGSYKKEDFNELAYKFAEENYGSKLIHPDKKNNKN